MDVVRFDGCRSLTLRLCPATQDTLLSRLAHLNLTIDSCKPDTEKYFECMKSNFYLHSCFPDTEKYFECLKSNFYHQDPEILSLEDFDSICCVIDR